MPDRFSKKATGRRGKALQLPPHVSLHAAPRERLADTVARQLLDLIAGMAPGSRLPTVEELAKQLGVSRPTVRRAGLRRVNSCGG